MNYYLGTDMIPWRYAVEIDLNNVGFQYAKVTK